VSKDEKYILNPDFLLKYYPFSFPLIKM